MKKIYFLVILIILNFSFALAQTYENSTINLSVDISEPVAKISISSDEIYFGEITKGYETPPKNLSITNIGTLDIKVNLVLNENSNNIFNYLKVGSTTCSSYSNYSTFTSGIIDHSSVYGENGETYNICLKLDLKSYPNEISESINLSTQMTFWVMPN